MNPSINRYQEGFRKFSEITQRDNENLYPSLAKIFVKNKFLLKFGEVVEPSQPFPNIVMGAIHYLLLIGMDTPLQAYYGSLNENPIPPNDVLEYELIKFCKQNEKKLIELCSNKRTQTNEVARSSLLYIALSYIIEQFEINISLIEIGSSAGLLLNFDKYQYTFSHLSTPIGHIGSKLHLFCEVKGELFPPLMIDSSKIVNKLGIDLFPIMAENKEDLTWLKALVWPSQLERFERLNNAIEILENQSVNLIKGDGFQDMSILDTIKLTTDGRICLYHSFTMNQIHEKEREQFRNHLTQYSFDNDLTIFEISLEWLDNDGPKIILFEYNKGKLKETHLANCHHHGRWIEWLVT